MIVVAFALIALMFGYLAVNTPKQQGALQILNYLMAYITVFFTGYLAYGTKATGTEVTELLSLWNNSFYAAIALVFGYFLVKILGEVLDYLRDQ